ncbi:hypothetical protein [Piscirickettsia salmonis]|nr:hypothetical protein [Piscirickettsia salmonis]
MKNKNFLFIAYVLTLMLFAIFSVNAVDQRRVGDVYFVFDKIAEYKSYLPMYQNIDSLPVKVNAGIGVQLTGHSSIEIALGGYVATQNSAILTRAGMTCGTNDHCLLVDLNAFTLTWRYTY